MPLKPGSSSETVGENIRELHTGDTYAHTSEKFGKERANKQAVAIALSEARKHRASGGRAAAERVLPANHQLGMRVPDGGSNCAKCRFFKAPRDCDNKGFIEWNGSPRLPDPADRYCCDLYLAPARGRAEGGALSDDDEAAMMPETYANPLVRDALAAAARTMAAPGNIAKPNPYPEGSEEANWYENQRAGAMVPSAVDLAGMTTIGAGAMPAEEDALRMGIKAYHGSPHDFDAFDLSKIGTGEGAQAYGHGLYFAENEKVATDYRDALSNATINGNKFNPNDPLHAAVAAVDRVGSRETALRNQIEEVEADPTDWFAKDVLNYLRTKSPLPKLESGGKMYEVNINADPEHFLDWDKPLGEQSPQAIEAMYKAGYQVPRQVPTAESLQNLRDKYGEWGQMQADAVAGMMRRPASEFIPRTAEAAGGLRDAGIPGIKYLDQGSRMPTSDFTVWAPRVGEADQQFTVRGPGNVAHGKFDTREEARAFADQENAKLNPQTHNYVVFDDKLIDILRKYGLAGIPAAGVAVGAAQDDQGRAAGGAMNGAVRQAIARAKGGKIHVGPIETDHGGRTDTEEMKVPDGAYVLPADAISHMGENNSQAGLKKAQELFGPGGHHAPPRSAGGKTSGTGKPVDCVTAGGEFVIAPETVKHIGGGDLARGHKILDQFVMRMRKDHISTLARLPPPAQD